MKYNHNLSDISDQYLAVKDEPSDEEEEMEGIIFTKEEAEYLKTKAEDALKFQTYRNNTLAFSAVKKLARMCKEIIKEEKKLEN